MGALDTVESEALELMTGFAERTGLTSARPAERYLWTDAFAVCNFLALGEVEPARKLVDQVHHVLGRHRADDPRRGWISGLDEAEAERHPTVGGLRIGKRLPERAPHEAADDRLEWDRDGQYFHYLTRWMHALDQAARSLGVPVLNRWARELAEVANRAFTFPASGGFGGTGRAMHWKMSVDLSRPLVASMGHHDPLDGYLTCRQLDAALLGPVDGPDLGAAAVDFATMIPANLATADPLGIGEVLADASRAEQLERIGWVEAGLVERLLEAALVGLSGFVRSGELDRPATERLAFRELGLAIGLAAATGGPGNRPGRGLSRVRAFAPLGARIVDTWRRPEHRASSAWLEHRDINEVMLATGLVPDGYLTLHGLA